MRRTLFVSGNSVVVSLPTAALDRLGWSAGTRVSVTLDAGGRRIIVASVDPPTSGVDETFARQLDAFIAEYGTALRSLANWNH